MPTLALIATGGTIAGAAASATDTTGYTAGTLGADALLAAVPQLGEIGAIRAEQPFNLDSKDMGPAHWLQLGRRAQALLDAPDIDGLIITHGTDTLEETAAYLHLTLATRKAVVLTAAMRPATALSADGPMNLYNATCVAAHPDSAGRGVLVSIGDAIFSAWGVRKRYTHRLDAFAGGPGGAIGQHAPIRFFAPAQSSTASAIAIPAGLTELPRVDILHVAAGSPPDLLDAVLAAGACGIVLALPGNGSLPASWENAVMQTAAKGVPIVRASRAGAGPVGPKARDAIWGTCPAGDLPPSQARVALMLALACGDVTTLARLFTPYIP